MSLVMQNSRWLLQSGRMVRSGAATVVLFLACGGEPVTPGPTEPPPPPPPPAVVATVDVSFPVVGGLEVGDTAQLSVTLRDAAGNILTDREITWGTSDGTVATVDEAGVLTGVGLGETRVTAESEGVERSLSVTIIAPIPLSFVASRYSTCALNGARRAYCWGWNYFGELGTTAVDPEIDSLSVVPVPVAGDRSYRRIAGGSEHVCGLTRYGEVYCWGAGKMGQLGVGSLPVCRTRQGTDIYCALEPSLIPGQLRFSHIDAGGDVTCGVTVEGLVYCWGRNKEGQLGGATSETCGYSGFAATCSTAPLAVGPLPKMVSVSVGFIHACGLAADGGVHCWGNNLYGQFGNGTADSLQPPTSVAEWGVVQAFASGTVASCALSETGAAYCSGENTQGNLGDLTVKSSLTPQPVFGSLTFASLSSRTGNSVLGTVCAVTDGSEAFCWGSNRFGEFGSATTGTCFFPPTQTRYPCSSWPRLVDGGHEFIDVDVGFKHTCGRTATLEVYCWGSNIAGQLGDGTRTDRPAPVPVMLPSG